MGRVCKMYEGDEKCVQSVGWKLRRKETVRKTKLQDGTVTVACLRLS
jgi:hypothetical protein